MSLAGLTTRLIDFCYPPACLACEVALDEGANDRTLCARCADELSKLAHAPFCDRCGLPSATHGAPCAHCEGKGVPHFERVIRLGVFDDPLKHLVHEMKYHRRWQVAEFLGDRLVEHEPVKALLQQDTEVLVPVPLHVMRHIARGFNQAEVIARTIGRRCGLPVAKPIARIRRTPMQTKMPSPAKREENMRGAFELLAGDRIAGKHVVLIDDVMTTGATLQAAARALVAARPASISALTLAVADPKHQDFQSI